jgi:CheY-like chemotaxis protein
LGRLGEVHVVDSFEAALQVLRTQPFDFVVSQTSDFLPLERAAASLKAEVVLNTIAEGVCVIDPSGRMLWSNQKLDGFSPEVVQRVRQMCAEAFTNRAEAGPPGRGAVRSHRLRLMTANDRCLEVNATPILDQNGQLSQIAAVVWDSTRSRRLQQKIDAIDTAGRELVGIDAETIRRLDVPERLALLEDKIIRCTQELMRFDNFVVRLLDKKTQSLELVLCTGLPPEAQQLDMYASTEGNGISGYVAATGRSYICPDVQHDPRYLRGIDNARSSLTVPLRLHDQIIGIFNVESDRPAAFTEDDRQFAEIFARYVAMALNVLDLLAVERHQTTGQLASDVAAEIAGPLNDILSDVTTLREDYIGHDDLRHRLNAIADNVVRIRDAIKEVTRPPCGLLGHRDERLGLDPLLSGKTVLVVDDEEIIRETIHDVLNKVGCVVETARDGDQAVAMLAQRSYDLVLSDIKMPGKSGYEVFAAAKKARAECPVIFMTGFGYDPNHSVIRARQEGLSAVLFKPFKVDEFLTEVRAAMVKT